MKEVMSEPKKPNNLVTGLILGSIAMAFFFGVIIKRVWFS